MNPEWRLADERLRGIAVRGGQRNERVAVSALPPGIRCIGLGTDAAVFAADDVPGVAYKVYADTAAGKLAAERRVYERLRGIPYFPVYYGEGGNYLAISHEPGLTLYDCLLQGVAVPAQVVRDVEEARRLARERGLNPRDIHLKNVLLQNGRGKVLDVSEYVVEGDDGRWAHLRWAYRRIYPFLARRRMPAFLLAAVSRIYWLLRGGRAGRWNRKQPESV